MEVDPNPMVGVNEMVWVNVEVGGGGVWVAVLVAGAVEVLVPVKKMVGNPRGTTVVCSSLGFPQATIDNGKITKTINTLHNLHNLEKEYAFKPRNWQRRSFIFIVLWCPQPQDSIGSHCEHLE